MPSDPRPDPRPGIFVGRGYELGQLCAERRRSELGELRVALVLGGPGAGKSRLAEEAGSRSDALHLLARSSTLRPRPPLEQWAQTLQGAVRGEGTSGHGAGLGGSSDGRLPERVVRLLGVVSARRPVTLTLDDVHWADDSLWELLLRLAQDTRGGRLFVLATARPSQLPGTAAAAEALTALDHAGVLHRVELHPLSPGELGELAASATTTTEEGVLPRLVEWLAGRSQGNPRLAAGLLEVVEGGADPDLDRPASLPRSLIRWVLSEVARLRPAESRLLELLAVVRNPVDPGDLAGMAESSTAEVAIAIESLIRSGLVVEREHGRSLAYEIEHRVVADALYDQICGARRRVLHRHVAGILMASGRIDTAAWHLIRSARVGDVQALDALVGELRNMDRRRSRAGVWALVPALVDLLPAGDERWIEVSDAVSRPCTSLVYSAERYSPSQMGALLKIEEQLARVGDLRRQAAVRLRRAGFLAYAAGDADSGPRECRHALELSRQAGRRHDHRMTEVELAKMAGWFGDVRGQERSARRLLAEAENEADPRGVVVALGVIGVALSLQGRFVDAESALVRCAELGASTELGHLVHEARALLAVLDVVRGQGEGARARAGGVSEPAPHRTGHRSNIEAFTALLTGDLATVRERGRQAPVLDLEVQLPQPPWLVLLAAMAEAEGGRVAEARRGLTLAGQDHRGDERDLFSQFRRWGEGLVLWAEERLVAAGGVLESAARSLSAMPAPAVEAYVLADLVEVATAASERGTAEGAARRIEEIADQLGAPSYEALHHFASAWVLLADSQRDEAAMVASMAVEGLGASGFHLLQARALVLYAGALQVSERKAAVDALHEAVAIFDAAGAVLRRERARRQLAQLGSSGRRAAARLGAPALTEREAEVAELAARGFPARHIADGLHIGIRTVETHLARIYPKLGVASKQQLISRGAELGLVPSVRESARIVPRRGAG